MAKKVIQVVARGQRHKIPGELALAKAKEEAEKIANKGMWVGDEFYPSRQIDSVVLLDVQGDKDEPKVNPKEEEKSEE